MGGKFQETLFSRASALFTSVDFHVLCVAAMNVTVLQASICMSVRVYKFHTHSSVFISSGLVLF